MAGVIDSSYRGEIGVILYNTDKDNEFKVSVGDRIAQLIIESHHNFDFVEVQDLTDTSRGDGGFGSTGGFAAFH
jgi:dUTP pyrophosphatase